MVKPRLDRVNTNKGQMVEAGEKDGRQGNLGSYQYIPSNAHVM